MRAAIRQVLFSQTPFSPRSLFTAGEQGVWYDPSDFSTMFQDSAGTTPVTAIEQPVGLILDKSGRGNHASQSTTTSRPILKQDETGRYFLDFDGTDDWLQTGNIDFSAPGKISVFAGVRKLRNTPVGTLIVLGANYLANGAFEIGAPWVYSTVQRDYIVAARGSTSGGSNVNIRAYEGYDAPITNVLTANILSAAANSAASQSVRINAVTQAGTSVENLNSTGVFANAAIAIGNRPAGGSLFNGRIYSIIIRGALTSTPQLEQVERWVAAKTGVSL